MAFRIGDNDKMGRVSPLNVQASSRLVELMLLLLLQLLGFTEASSTKDMLAWQTWLEDILLSPPNHLINSVVVG